MKTRNAVYCKKIIRLVISVLLVQSTSYFVAQQPEVKCETYGLAEENVFLYSASDSDFDARVTHILGDKGKLALSLRPYLAIISNKSNKTVVAYAVSWKFYSADLKPLAEAYVQFKFPNAVAGAPNARPFPRGQEIRPGEERIIGTAFDVGHWVNRSSAEQFIGAAVAKQRERYMKAALVRIGITAIFEDGRMEGPDESNLKLHFSNYVKEEQNVFLSVTKDIEAGKSIDIIFAPITKSALDPTPITKPLDLYPRLAAQDASADRLKYGDGAIYGMFKSAQRPEPFVVYAIESQTDQVQKRGLNNGQLK